MDYITAKEAAGKWGISQRRVQVLCTQGKIQGAKKLGWAWAIPSKVEKPKDARTTDEKKRSIWGENMLNNTLTNENKKRLMLQTAAELEKWIPKINRNIDYDNDAYQVVDLFCGSGGMSLGFAVAGTLYKKFKLIGGFDINPDACKSYEENFGIPCMQGDVRNLAEDNNEYDKFLNAIGYDSEKPALLIGCAPCQGFSSHRKKHWDEIDERNDLVIAFAKVVKKMKPDCVVMENVPELLSKKYWDYFATMKKMIEDEGYIVKQAIYNAAAFGVPQERFRSVVIGMKKNFVLPQLLFDKEQYRTVRDAIGSLPAVSPGEVLDLDNYHKCANHKESTIDVIKQVPKNGGNRPIGVGPKCLDKVKGFSDVYGRLKWDAPSITITGSARNPASGRFVHPEQDRGLTIREAACLQSFPKGFLFEGKFDSIFMQIGEAVPPLLSSAIATSILVDLYDHEKESYDEEELLITQPVSSSYSSVIAGLKIRR